MLLSQKIISCLIDKNAPLKTSEISDYLDELDNADFTVVEEKSQRATSLSKSLSYLCQSKKVVSILSQNKGYRPGHYYCLAEWFEGTRLKKEYQLKLKNKIYDIKLALVDDQILVRKALKALLQSMGFEIQIEADDREMLIKELAAAPSIPNVCIISSPTILLDNSQLMKKIKARYREMKVLLLANYYHEYLIHKMIYDGMNGYLQKSCHPEQLNKAIISIYQNGRYWDTIPGDPLGSFSTKARNHGAISEIHQKFLSLLVTDLTYDEIAQKLGVTERTVGGYREALFERFNVSNRSSLVVFVIRNGLLDLK